MCVSRVGRVVSIDADRLVAQVTTSGGSVPVGLVALDQPVAAGDWVLLNAGLAIARLTDDDVAELVALGEGDGRGSWT